MGHDIETSWLIDRGTEVLGDPAYREKLLPITGGDCGKYLQYGI